MAGHDVEHPHRERLPFAPERSAASAHLPEGAPSRAWRRLDRLVLAVTLAGLLLPGSLLAVGIHDRPIENRPLVAMPGLGLGGLLDGTWFAGVDAFLADNIAVRAYAVRVRGEVFYRLGGTGNPEVLRGRDGWLFTRGEFEPDCRYSSGQLLAALADAASAAAAKGITFRFVAVPDKHAIYPEELAADPFPPACSEIDRAALRTGLAGLGRVGIDGWSALEAAKLAGGPELYYHGDTHWTPAGAAEIVKALVRSIDPALWSDADATVHGTKSRSVDLALQLGIRRIERVPNLVLRPSVSIARSDLAVPVDIHNARAVFTTTATGPEPTVPGRTLVIYDSFFGLDVNLVAPFFANATWVHVGDMGNHPELATLLGPFDTIVLERVERGLYGTDLATTLGRLGQ
jgi:acetyltransferase AlgX (SGNH hydrolase-like protein)